MKFFFIFFAAVALILPTSNMFAANESYNNNIDFSNIDLIGIIKSKGKGEYKARTVQPLSVDEADGDTIFVPVDPDPQEFNPTAFTADLVSILTNLATIIFIIDSNSD